MTSDWAAESDREAARAVYCGTTKQKSPAEAVPREQNRRSHTAAQRFQNSNERFRDYGSYEHPGT